MSVFMLAFVVLTVVGVGFAFADCAVLSSGFMLASATALWIEVLTIFRHYWRVKG